MHCKPHFEALQNPVPRKDSLRSLSPVRLPVTLIPSIAMSTPISSGNTTPISTRRSTTSSIFNESNISSSSSNSSSSSLSSASRPKYPSMKSSFRTTESAMNRRSAPPTVRFLDPEPVSNPKIRGRAETFGPTTNTRPTFQQLDAMPFTLNSSMVISPPLSQQRRHRFGKRFSAPVEPVQTDPRWSGIPLPAHFTPPRSPPPSRIASYGSIISNSSTQSAPAVFSSPPPSTITGLEAQYNPLQNHIPCIHPRCTTHYSPTHTGPNYYLPQGPYQLPRHRGYCPRHAAQDLKEANALCKAEWERMRQNAGRKTLGAIAAEFDDFLVRFRHDRREEALALEEEMEMRILGPASATITPSPKGKQPALDGDEWDWRYTPRPCTKHGCTAPLYSPYANFIHAFYTTRRRSSLLPLQALCPSCSRAEIQAFERKIMEKWGSRCGGWDDAEWNQWFEAVVFDRDVEGEFWERAQERVVREKGPARRVAKETEEVSDVVAVETTKKGKRKSIFKKLFKLAA